MGLDLTLFFFLQELFAVQRCIWGRCQILLPMEGVISTERRSICSMYRIHTLQQHSWRRNVNAQLTLTFGMHSVMNVDTSPCLSLFSLQFMIFYKPMGNTVCFNNFPNYSPLFCLSSQENPLKSQTRNANRRRESKQHQHQRFGTAAPPSEICSHTPLTICNVCFSLKNK